MKLRYLFVVNTIVSLLLALGLLVQPAIMLMLYGITVSSAGDKLLGQFFGVYMLLCGLITLFTMDASNAKGQQAIGLALFITYAVGLVVAIGGALSRGSSAMGWVVVLVYLFFAVAFGYFRFIHKE